MPDSSARSSARKSILGCRRSCSLQRLSGDLHGISKSGNAEAVLVNISVNLQLKPIK